MSTSGTLYDEAIKFGHGKLLLTQSASNSAWLAFVEPLALDYDTIHFELINLYPVNATASPNLMMQASADAVPNWSAASYWWSTFQDYSRSAGVTYGGVSLGGEFVTYYQLMGGHGSQPASGEVFLGNRKSGDHAQVNWHTAYHHTSIGQVSIIGGGMWVGGGIIGVRFLYTNGAIASGTIRCYGLKTGN